jgi:hypothetical protein
MNQDKMISAFNKNDINSIFKNKPKPISYVKGDITYISEISEDSLIVTSRGIGNGTSTKNEINVARSSSKTGSKKGINKDMMNLEKQVKIGIYH